MKMNENTLFIEIDDLPAFGESLARTLHVGGMVPARRVAADIRRTLKKLREDCESNSLAGEADREWLRDNFYLLQRDALGSASAFQHAGKLRCSDKREALVLAVSNAMIDSGAGEWTQERLCTFLEGFQRVLPLKEAELSLLPDALRAALLAYLSRTGTHADAVITSLRRLENTLFSKLLEQESSLHWLLLQDPSGVYEKMDEESRRDYRRRAAELGRKQGISEWKAAECALTLAERDNCHVGKFLFRKPMGKQRSKALVTPYLLLHLLFPAGLTLYLCYLTHSSVPLLTFLPLQNSIKYLFDSIYTRLTRPKRLPRLDLSNGIPTVSRTLAVSAVLLTKPEDARKAVGKLEQFRLANRDAGENLYFGLLMDLPESSSAVMPLDEAIQEAVETEITRLNSQYGGGFCLLTRQRSYSKADSVWRGRERKRGAIMALTGLLRNEQGNVSVFGDKSCIRDIRYLIVLDGDTRLTMGSAASLVSILSHPMQHDCTILQPKISTALADVSRSDFARIFAGQGGLDPYGSLNSDVYQDLFGEGSYSGKGILDVDRFRECLDGAFPPETLLSHDLIEGAYAGCAYVSDVELTDGFPAGLWSYYERQHRWIRGDWQTILWLGRTVRNENGKRIKNPISALSRWKILDNLFRSLAPVNTFLSILLYGAFPGNVTLLCAGLSLAALALRIVVNATAGVRRGKRYRARALPTAKRDFLQFLWIVLLLPYAAYVHVSAVLTALYRTFLSHQKMLLWVTAAEGDLHDQSGVMSYCRRMWFSFLAGTLALLCVPTVIKALGVLWITAPIMGWFISQENNVSREPTADQRTEYTRCAADIWRFFRDTMTAERHFLPPDNLQFTSQTVIAERTSPTNIGLALLSIVAALDLGLCDAEEGWDRIRNAFSTVERLPKYRGHLYNWYDVRTETPLEPAFLSTVDSGNLLACLYVLSAAAEESGETALYERVRKVCNEMKLDFLYDADKRLFHIGWDPKTDKPAGGWYDLLESEARITSYVALCRGEAPKKHWQRLGRILATGDGMSGLSSWTGTMFEYFMPVLFMPAPEGSLLGESLEFCLRVQKQSARSGVWGKSESAFSEMDAAGNYSYKAHGAQKLALKRNMDRDAVYAPYAAFLAVEMAPNAVLRNLRRLRSFGMEGKYGFFEALDLTPERCRDGEAIPVRCFMAHHLGMSLLSIDNFLCGGAMQRRFLSEPMFASCTELLEERTPVGQRIRTEMNYRSDVLPSRIKAAGFRLHSETPDFLRPMTGLLSNGRISVLMSETGYHRSHWRNISLTAADPSLVSAFPGICFFAEVAGEVFPLQPLPFDAPDMSHSAAYDGECFLQDTRYGEMEFRVRTRVSDQNSAEINTVTLLNSGKGTQSVTLAMYLEPALCREESYASHPAFHRLCLESRGQGGCVTIARRPGGREPAAALAVACDTVFEVETDKAEIFGHGGIRSLPEAIGRQKTDIRDAEEPCIFLRVRLMLRPKERKTVRFAIGAGETPELAAEEATEALEGKAEQTRFRNAVQKYTQGQEEMAFRLLTQLHCPTPEKAALQEANRAQDIGVGGLWRCGVSGDLPVAACEKNDGEALLRCHAFLRQLGYSFDLVIRTTDSGVYGNPEQTELRKFAASLGMTDLENMRGGWHFFFGNDREWAALLANADCFGTPEPQKNEKTCLSLPGMIPRGTDTKATRSMQYDPDGVTAITEAGIGLRAWSTMLTNGRMGWMAADDGSGCVWLDNARENRLTCWQNDPLSPVGAEELYLVRDGRAISLFAAPDAYRTETTFGFGFIRWRRQADRLNTEVIGFIPPERDLRILLIRMSDIRESDRVRWLVRTEPGAEISAFASEAPLRSGNTLPGWFGAETRSGESCFWAEYPAKSELLLTMCTEAESVNISEAKKKLWATKEHWKQVTESIRLQSPCQSLDRYVNGWCIYQTLACRVLGRSSLYQSGGAFGFRDQLQDICALIDPFPALARNHILLAAAHQYEEGDVMHWWHPGKAGDRGVRTRCSDDLLWLPYAALIYVEKTGDQSVFDENVPWLHSEPLRVEESDRYESPEKRERGTLMEHLRRALELVMSRGCGEHGLLCMGAGDWNDGFDKVQGESVWLTWFAAMVLRMFGELTGEMGWISEAKMLADAADACFRDGHYLRAYYANGAPMGAAGDSECEIDSIAQSFAVFCGMADPEKSRAAVRKAAETLLDPENRLVKLFAPPFNGEAEPGYIRSYLPGVRENGGQYTHAAVWLAGACLRCGETEIGWKLLQTLLPGERDEAVYQVEPFVLSADVYANPDMKGRGGWSWYTGAAGWFLRTTMEELLGVKVKSGELTVRPRLPADWNGYTLEYSACGSRYQVTVKRENGKFRTEVKKL